MTFFNDFKDALDGHAFELAGVAGLALIFVAGWIRWRISWLDSDVEEAVKDGKLTQGQAEMRAWMVQLATPVLMLIGLALLGMAVAGYTAKLGWI